MASTTLSPFPQSESMEGDYLRRDTCPSECLSKHNFYGIVDGMSLIGNIFCRANWCLGRELNSGHPSNLSF